MTLVEQLERNAKELPLKPAVIYRDRQISYRQLDESANRLADYFLERGLKKGDRVGFMLPRIPELVISFLAVAKAGGILVPINFELTDKEIRAIVDTVLPKYLIVHTSFLDVAKSLGPDSDQIPIIAVGDENGKCLSWQEVLKKGKPKKPSVNIKNNDIIYLNYTSGSTGNSKGAITTHSNIYWNTVAAVEALGLKNDDVHLCMFAPFAHPHEIIARPLYLGGTMVLVDKIYPKSLAKTISNQKVTCVMGLAPMYEHLLAVLKLTYYDLSSLRIPESGGMYTHPKLVDRFKKEVGVPIVPVWGSTETTGIAIANRPNEDILAGSVGKPCSSYEVKIVDRRGRDVPSGNVGEMIFRGPAVVGGYYNYGTSAQSCLRDGWYYSGDLCKRDEHGNFYFVSRQNEMMKVAGLKVYPLEIELVSLEHPGIEELAVFSSENKLRGEVPKAIIVAKEGVELSKKEILRFWRQRLAHYKIPRIVEIRKSLPKFGNGKIDKNVLQMESI